MPPKAAPKAAAEPKAKAQPKAVPKPKAKAEKKEKVEEEENKVPKPDREAHEEALTKISEKMEALQKQVKVYTDQINERSGGKEDYNYKRTECRVQLDEFKVKIDALLAKKEEINKAKGNQRQEGVEMRAELNKMKKSIGGFVHEADVDERIKEIERIMVTDSLTLKEEKDYMKEISELKKRRPQIAKVKGMEANVQSFGSNSNFKEQLDIINAELNQYFEGKRVVQEQLKKIQEERTGKVGDLSDIFTKREDLNKKIQEHIQERNQLRDEFREKEREFNAYLKEVRERKNAQWQEERAAKQVEWEKSQRMRQAEKLDEQPYVSEMALVEQTLAFCKTFLTSKETEEKEEKKEIEHKLDKGMEILTKKEDREEFYFIPTAKKKAKAPKAKGSKAEGTKAIRHNAISFQLFDKLKLDAPITTDDIPALVEKLEEMMESYKNKVKEWAEKREEKKRRILEGVMPAEDKAEDGPAEEDKPADE